MDIQEFIDQNSKKVQERYESEMAEIQNTREQLEHDRQTILNDSSIPEKTDMVDMLAAFNGKMVRISTSERGWVPSAAPLNFNPEDMSVLIDGDTIYSFVGDDYINSIDDTEAKVNIYHNYFDLSSDDSVTMQAAKLFGKKAGLENYKKEMRYLAIREAWIKEYLESSLSALQHTHEFTTRGEKLIYPQMQEEWEECVQRRISDLYHGMDLENALEIMEALDAGKSIEEVEQLVDDGHSGGSYGSLVSIVTEFSKRGVEFAKAASHGYKYALKSENKKAIEEWEKSFKDIEERNAKFEEELGKGQMS